MKQWPLLDFWVGIFVLMGLLATLFIALRVADLISFDSGDYYQLNAEFDNVGSLKVRAPVKSAGVTVGRVADIQYDSALQKAVLIVELNQSYQFSVDSSMRILTSGILGEQYLGIQGGADKEMLQPGDTVWLTSSAVILESLVSDLMVNLTRAQRPEN